MHTEEQHIMLPSQRERTVLELSAALCSPRAICQLGLTRLVKTCTTAKVGQKADDKLSLACRRAYQWKYQGQHAWLLLRLRQEVMHMLQLPLGPTTGTRQLHHATKSPSWQGTREPQLGLVAPCAPAGCGPITWRSPAGTGAWSGSGAASWSSARPPAWANAPRLSARPTAHSPPLPGGPPWELSGPPVSLPSQLPTAPVPHSPACSCTSEFFKFEGKTCAVIRLGAQHAMQQVQYGIVQETSLSGGTHSNPSG